MPERVASELLNDCGRIPMIAPAMTTRKRQPETDQAQPAQTYRDLARNSVMFQRRIDVQSLPRLNQMARLCGPVEAAFRFSVVDGHPAVAGEASVEAELPCQWCDTPQVRTVRATFEVMLAEDEAEARHWSDLAGDEAPVIAVVGTAFDAAALVEDELLLAVPGRVCTDPECEHRPPAGYGEATPERGKPLAGLKALLDSNQVEE